jgi:hypothetical protein
MTPDTAPQVLVAWEETLGEVLDRTQRFPKSARFTFVARIDGLALDVLAALVSARYAPRHQRKEHLQRADLDLAVLRSLVRLAHSRRLLDTGGLESLSRRFDEVGRMIGGWRAWLGVVGEGA